MFPKRIYFVRRHPDVAPGGFVARWREHGRLAMHFMALQGWRNVLRYVHCDVVRAPEIAGLAADWDGMGIVLFRDARARRDHVGFAAARQALEADEDEAFAARVNRSGLVAREEMLREGRADGLKLVRVFDRPQGMSEAAFASWWRDVHVPRTLQAAGASLLRHAANWPLPPENGTAWGLDCAAIEELWLPDGGAVARVLEAQRRTQDTHAGIAPRFALLTREAVLYDALTPPR